jgi:hypothetical protein
MKIKSIYVPYRKHKYLVTYVNGRKIWYDLNKASFRDEQSILRFILMAKHIPINAPNGERIAHKYIKQD